MDFSCFQSTFFRSILMFPMYVSNLIITKNDHEKSSRRIIYCCVHFLMVTSNDLRWPEMTIRQKWCAVKRNTIFLVEFDIKFWKIFPNQSKNIFTLPWSGLIWLYPVWSCIIPGSSGRPGRIWQIKLRFIKSDLSLKWFFKLDWNRKSPKIHFYNQEYFLHKTTKVCLGFNRKWFRLQSSNQPISISMLLQA